MPEVKPTEVESKASIKVVGVGGAGGSAVERMKALNLSQLTPMHKPFIILQLTPRSILVKALAQVVILKKAARLRKKVERLSIKP